MAGSLMKNINATTTPAATPAIYPYVVLPNCSCFIGFINEIYRLVVRAKPTRATINLLNLLIIIFLL